MLAREKKKKKRKSKNLLPWRDEGISEEHTSSM